MKAWAKVELGKRERCHLPFCHTNLRRKIFRSLVATDATPSSAGSTRAGISSRRAESLFHRSCRRGKQLRIDGSQPQNLEEEKNYLQSSAVDSLGEKPSWRITKQYAFRETSHFNLQELRAIKKEVVDWTCVSNDRLRNTIHCSL